MAGEAPSPERLRRALREGDSPISHVLVRVAALGAILLVGPAAATALATRFAERLRAALTGNVASTVDVALDVAVLAGPVVAAAAAVAIVTGLSQTSGVVTFRKAAPSAGFGRLFDGRRMYEAVRGGVTAVFIVGGVGWVLSKAAPDIAASIGRNGSVLTVASAVVRRALGAALWPLGVAAIVDVVVQRAAWIDRWSLSPQDRKREQRDAEGDPNLKRERRRAHEELLRDPRAVDEHARDASPPRA